MFRTPPLLVVGCSKLPPPCYSVSLQFCLLVPVFYSRGAPPNSELNCGVVALVSVRQRFGPLCLVLVGTDAVAEPLWAVGDSTAPQMIILHSPGSSIPAILHFKECRHADVCAFLSVGFFCGGWGWGAE